MLILKLSNEREIVKKTRCLFGRKKDSTAEKEFNRYSININGENVLVLELFEKNLSCEDVTTLLKIYKGKVLVAKENQNNEFIKSYLFSPERYYQRAILSSLKKQIITVRREWKCITVKVNEFTPCKELFEIVKISKKVNLVTPKNAQTIKFVNDCYNEYGAIVSINSEYSTVTDVFLDLDKLDNNGKLIINVKEKPFLLYPDTTYFQSSEEYSKLIPYGIDHNIICAAFSNK